MFTITALLNECARFSKEHNVRLSLECCIPEYIYIIRIEKGILCNKRAIHHNLITSVYDWREMIQIILEDIMNDFAVVEIAGAVPHVKSAEITRPIIGEMDSVK